MKATQQTNGIIGVHFQGGARRTGTIIAPYVMIQDINQQIECRAAPNRLEIITEKAF